MHQLCPEWVEVNVTNKFQEVGVFLAHNGFVTVLEEMACAFMAFIEGDGVSGHQFAHNRAEGCRAAGAQEKVKVVRDQGPSMR